MNMAEAPLHPHNVARGTFVELEGIVQPAPAPRFSATPGAIQSPPPARGAHNEIVLRDWGIDAKRIEQLRSAQAI
jgi:alpha-methylacyl-CoA racemase